MPSVSHAAAGETEGMGRRITARARARRAQHHAIRHMAPRCALPGAPVQNIMDERHHLGRGLAATQHRVGEPPGHGVGGWGKSRLSQNGVRSARLAPKCEGCGYLNHRTSPMNSPPACRRHEGQGPWESIQNIMDRQPTPPNPRGPHIGTVP